jgi:hypothetical protein
MRSYLFVVFLFFGFVKTYAQTISGKVVDEVTGETIPFVSIGVLGTNNATVTNDAGEFVLKDVAFPAKLRFSHVSYLLSEQRLTASDPVVIKLKPAAITLKPVVVDPYQGLRLVKAAIEKAETYEKQNFYGKAFYRQLTTLNGKPSQIYELFYDLEFNVSKVKGWIAKQSRFAELNEGATFSLSNQSYLTFSFAGYLFKDKKNYEFVTLKNLNDFQISIDKYIEQQDQEIAVVSCKFKGNKKKFYINTTYYIGVSNHHIYRQENSIFNLPMKVSGSTPKMPPVVTTIATFNSVNTPIPIIESISTKLYLNLNTKHGPLNPIVSSMLTVYQLDENLNNQKFVELSKSVKDKSVIESVDYNAGFWKDNPVVKQTALEDSFIKMMESKSAFGTMINP